MAIDETWLFTKETLLMGLGRSPETLNLLLSLPFFPPPLLLFRLTDHGIAQPPKPRTLTSATVAVAFEPEDDTDFAKTSR